MTQKKSLRTEGENQVFILIPKADFNRFDETQQQILAELRGVSRNTPGVGDFIAKEDAEKILGRKQTTLWKLRKEGKIKSAKIGSEVFYSKQSILDYLNENLR